MRLGIGLCYAVLMADGSVVTFRFLGQDARGTVLAESPPGSGTHIDLLSLLNEGYMAYWEIDCPK